MLLEYIENADDKLFKNYSQDKDFNSFINEFDRATNKEDKEKEFKNMSSLVNHYAQWEDDCSEYKYKLFEVTVDSAIELWLNEKNIKEKLGHKNLPVIINKYVKIYKKRRCELVNKSIKQSDRRFLHVDLALKIIMDCRTDKSCSLKTN